MEGVDVHGSVMVENDPEAEAEVERVTVVDPVVVTRFPSPSLSVSVNASEGVPAATESGRFSIVRIRLSLRVDPLDPEEVAPVYTVREAAGPVPM